MWVSPLDFCFLVGGGQQNSFVEISTLDNLSSMVFLGSLHIFWMFIFLDLL
jgi:hypothetical protein